MPTKCSQSGRVSISNFSLAAPSLHSCVHAVSPPLNAPLRRAPSAASNSGDSDRGKRGRGGRDAAGKGGWAGKTACDREEPACPCELEARPRFLSFRLVQSWIGLLERGGGSPSIWGVGHHSSPYHLSVNCFRIGNSLSLRSRIEQHPLLLLATPSGDLSLFSVSLSLPDVLSIGRPLIPPSVITTPGSSPCRFRAHLARSDLKDNRPSVAESTHWPTSNPRNQLPLSQCYERKAPTASRPH